MKKLIHTIQEHYGVVLFLVIYFSILAFKVIAHPTPFFDWDESIYIQVGKEMIQNHSLIPLYQGQAWLEKPPLAPLLYGIIETLPGTPEISTRLFSVLLAIGALALLYAWVLKLSKNRFFSLVVTIFTAFNPLFFQRAQIVNTDVLLLIGWLGYFLFYENFWASFIFLAVGVLTKSLLGFYPALLMGGYELSLFILKKNTNQLRAATKKIAIQIGIILIWYVVMIALFGSTFIVVHFEDHLFKRVTESIESHFGQRTFYLDIVRHQYGWFSLIAIVSLGILTFQFFKKKVDLFTYVFSVALVPWFVFLNLTKTKIDWYLFPAVPQITFLLLYPLLLIKNFKPFFYIVSTAIIGLYIFISFIPLYSTYYSSYDANYQLAVAARTNCDSLDLLIDSNDRKTHDVLQNLHLLISTSELYGTHPAMIYYYGKPLKPYYGVDQFVHSLVSLKTGSCIGIEKNDLPLLNGSSQYKKIGIFDRFYLMKRV